jgi:energy-coupling factor transporter ATP-binding protein EcfA2
MMATALCDEVTIENIGAIEQLRIPIPAEGGVVVLRGQNGTGKTTALRAAECLLTGKPAPGPSDGATRGVVEGFGVTMKVGKMTRRAGELTVSGLDGKFDVSRLVDPGIKDPVAADAARIKALIGLTGVEADRQTFVELAGGEAALEAAVSVEDLQTTDLVEMVARCKRGFERLARDQEKLSEHARAEAETYAKLGIAEDEDFPDVEQLRSAYAAASERVGALKRQETEAIRATAERERLKIELAGLSGETGPTVEALSTEWTAKNEAWIKAGDRIKALEQGLAEARNVTKTAAAEAESARTKLMSARRTDQQRKSLAESLASLESALAPSDEEIQAALQQQLDIEATMNRRAIYGEALRNRQSAEKAQLKAAQHAKTAASLRNKAGAAEDVLTEAVGKTGVGLRVLVKDAETRLVLDTERGVTPFAELSEGERWKLAIAVAIGCLPGNAVLFIRQEAWEGLDPFNRKLIDQQARAHGVTILAAEASADPVVRAAPFFAD